LGEPIIYISTKFYKKYVDPGQRYAPLPKKDPGMLYIWCMVAICQIGFLKETHLLGEPITYIPTTFCKNISIGGTDMPPKQALWLQNFPSGFDFDNVILQEPSYISSYRI